MSERVSVNYDNFVRKMAMVKLFYIEYHLKFEEIAIILNSRPEIIRIYYKRILH